MANAKFRACALAVMLMVAAGCGGGVAEAPASAPAVASPSPTPEAFDFTGTMTVEAWIAEEEPGGPCEAIDDYGDVETGAQVTVANASGDTIALGELESGVMSADEKNSLGNYRTCVFDFSVEDVPDGSIFDVAVADYSGVKFTKASLISGANMDLGDH